MTIKFTVASCNTPQGHHDVIPHAEDYRVNFLVNILNKEGAIVCALQEYGPRLRPAWDKRKRWSVIEGTNNNLPRQFVAMNAIAYRHDILEVVRRTEWSFDIPGRKIHIPVVVFRHKASDVRFVFIGVHIPRKQDAGRGLKGVLKRRQIETSIAKRAGQYAAYDMPVFIAGDRNSKRVGPFKRQKFTVGAVHYVDWIYGRLVHFLGAATVTAVHGNVTDHPAMMVAHVEI